MRINVRSAVNMSTESTEDWTPVGEFTPDKQQQKNENRLQNNITDLINLLVNTFKLCQDSTADSTYKNLCNKIESICADVIKNNNLYRNNHVIVFNDRAKWDITLKIDRALYGHIIGKKGAFINSLKHKYKNTEINVPLQSDSHDRHIEIKGENACLVIYEMLGRILC